MKTHKDSAVSTRQLTKVTGTFVRSTGGSQSLERGLRLLRAFRWTPSLTNAELANRCNLPRPTVSRLTHSLVDAGFLRYDISSSTYQLSSVFLALGKVFRAGSYLADLAAPTMQRIADEAGVNVGLSVCDQLDMVYIETIRCERSGLIQKAQAGTRLPIETTSAGLAYLSSMTSPEREIFLQQLIPIESLQAELRRQKLATALEQFQLNEYVTAEWQPNLIGIATYIKAPDLSVYAINISFNGSDNNREQKIRLFSPFLKEMAAEIHTEWHRGNLNKVNY